MDRYTLVPQRLAPGSGAHSALAPPADFAGDQYLAVIRRRYREDHEAQQCSLLAALRSRQPFGVSALTFLGPYAAWARHVVAAAAGTFGKPAQEG